MPGELADVTDSNDDRYRTHSADSNMTFFGDREDNEWQHGEKDLPSGEQPLDPQQIFDVFTTKRNRAQTWELLRQVVDRRTTERTKSFQTHEREQRRTMPGIEQYVLLRTKDKERTVGFACEHFPRKKYPTAQWDELYRETRVKLTEIVEFWLNQHNLQKRKRLCKLYNEGNFDN